MRARLTLAYAALFLAAGAVLLAVTYGLLAASLPGRPGPAIPKAENAKIMAACKEQLSNVSPAKCQRAARLGLQEQAASQKDQTLQRLLLFSLAGLGLMTVASGGLGWLMAGRVLRPVRSITETARRASRQQLGERIGRAAAAFPGFWKSAESPPEADPVPAGLGSLRLRIRLRR